MVEPTISSTHAVDDYLSSLLLDTQLTPQQADVEEPILRFAKVDKGFELVCLWAHPQGRAQQCYSDLFLLSCARTLTPGRLRTSVLNAVSFAQR